MSGQDSNKEVFRICGANFLLFFAWFFFFPLFFSPYAPLSLHLPKEAYAQLWAFIPGMFIAGTLQSYLVEIFPRKRNFLIASLVFAASFFVDQWFFFPYAQPVIQFIRGGVFGVMAYTGITLTIDVSATGCRDCNNRLFWLWGRLGICAGLISSLFLIHFFHRLCLVIVPAAAALAAGLLVESVPLPFRAPISNRMFSFDRFMLRASLLPAVNLLLLSAAFGALLLLFFLRTPLGEGSSPVAALQSAVYLPAVGYGLFLLPAFFFRHKAWHHSAIGLGVLGSLVAVLLFVFTPYAGVALLLFGVSFGLSSVNFLRLMLSTVRHCERSSANAMHLFFSETGFLIGYISMGCHAGLRASGAWLALTLTAVSSICYFAATLPYVHRCLRRKNETGEYFC